MNKICIICGGEFRAYRASNLTCGKEECLRLRKQHTNHESFQRRYIRHDPMKCASCGGLFNPRGPQKVCGKSDCILEVKRARRRCPSYKEWDKKYKQTESYKIYLKKYNRSEKRKAVIAKESYKIWLRQYRKNPRYKSLSAIRVRKWKSKHSQPNKSTINLLQTLQLSQTLKTK
jgi:hypothetical protein